MPLAVGYDPAETTHDAFVGRDLVVPGRCNVAVNEEVDTCDASNPSRIPNRHRGCDLVTLRSRKDPSSRALIGTKNGLSALSPVGFRSLRAHDFQGEIFVTWPNSSAIGPIKRTSRRIRAISRSLNALGSKGTRRIDSWIATLSLRSWRRARTEPKSLWLTRYSKPSRRTAGRSLASMKCSIAMATFSGGLGRITFFSAATRLSHRTGVRSRPYSAITAFGARRVMHSP